MDDSGTKSTKDRLDNYLDDAQGIKLMMEAHDLSYEDAKFMWNRFVRMVIKAKEINDSLK